MDLSAAERPVWEAKIESLLSGLAEEPKSVGWRLRDRIGRRKRWYRQPDESIDEG